MTDFDHAIHKAPIRPEPVRWKRPLAGALLVLGMLLLGSIVIGPVMTEWANMELEASP